MLPAALFPRADNRPDERIDLRQRLSVTEHFGEGCPAEDDRRPLHLYQSFSLEVGEDARDRLARGPDNLADFFVRKAHCEAHLLSSLVCSAGLVQKELYQLLLRRMRKTEHAHFIDCGVIHLGQLLRHPQGCFAVRAQKFKEIDARNEVGM